MKRKRYSAEKKTEIVLEIIREEKTLVEIAAEHEIHPVQLSKWKKEFLENAETVFGKEAKKAEKIKKAHEKEKLIKEIGQLTVEVNWLKKNLVSNKNLSERKALVNREDSEITIKRQCELLTVIRSVFYYQKKGVSLYELTLKREIDIIHTQIPFYGSRKIEKQGILRKQKTNREIHARNEQSCDLPETVSQFEDCLFNFFDHFIFEFSFENRFCYTEKIQHVNIF